MRSAHRAGALGGAGERMASVQSAPRRVAGRHSHPDAAGQPNRGSVVIEPLELGRDLADALAEKKGEDILLLDLTGVCTFADYFVLATGLSERTLQALADDLQRKFKGVGPGRRALAEGSAASGWILLDFGSVIVHLLSPAQRSFYRLEELWHEGRVVLRIT